MNATSAIMVAAAAGTAAGDFQQAVSKAARCGRSGTYVTACSNGRPLRTGAGYGIRLPASDRNRYFDPG
jgi:hypothetical protein